MGSISRLRKIAWAMPTATRLRLVKTLIVPLLSYGCTVTNSNSVSLNSKLNSALNVCTRFVYGLRMRDHISQYSNKILGSTLSQYQDLSIVKLIFQIQQRQDPTFLSERLRPTRSTRTSGILQLRNQHAAYDGMFFIRGITIWNRLPYDIRRISNVNKFKEKLKELLTEPSIWRR